MSPNEAHDYAMEVVEELRASGITVVVKPYKTTTIRGQEVLVKYGSEPDRASPRKWCNVDFKPEGDEQKQAITEAQRKLGWMGIQFDAGGGMGVVD